jgi:hypothetical protein
LLHKGEQPFRVEVKKKKMLQLILYEIKIAIVLLAKNRLCSVSKKKKSSKTAKHYRNLTYLRIRQKLLEVTCLFLFFAFSESEHFKIGVNFFCSEVDNVLF